MGLVYLIIVFILLPFISMVEAHGALCSDALLMVVSFIEEIPHPFFLAGHNYLKNSIQKR